MLVHHVFMKFNSKNRLNSLLFKRNTFLINKNQRNYVSFSLDDDDDDDRIYINPKKDNLPIHPCLKYVGFIGKSFDLEKFVNEITSWHFGTLFSKAEAYGISNRESLVLGVPVICHDVGGIRSTFPKEDYNFGCIFKSYTKPSVISDWILERIKDYSSYINLRDNVARNSYEFTWEPAIKKMFREISLIENSLKN